MSTKSKWLLGLALAANLVALTRAFPAISVGDDLADFAVGFGAALMLGVLVTWKQR